MSKNGMKNVCYAIIGGLVWSISIISGWMLLFHTVGI